MNQLGTRLKKSVPALTVALAFGAGSVVPAISTGGFGIAAVSVGALSLAMMPSTSHAQRIVFDPTNFAKNSVTAANAALTEANTYRAMIEQTKQTIAMARQVASLGGLADLAGLSEELALFQDLARTAMQLYNTIQESQHLYDNLQAQWGASNFTWQNFLQGQSAVQSNRVTSMILQFENAGRSVERVAQRRQVLLQKAQEAGTNESMMQITQVVSAQLDMLAGQNQQVVQMMANNIAVDAAKEKDRIQAEEFSWEVQRARQQKMRDAASSLH